MRAKLRSKIGEIDLGRKRSKAELCRSSGRRCNCPRRYERDEPSNVRTEASHCDV